MKREGGRGGGGSQIEELSRDLIDLAARLTCFAAGEARPGTGPAVTAREVWAVLRASMRRSALFGIDLSNPGWNMMLTLYAGELEGRRLYFARLAEEAGVPPTTALRWLDLLGEAGLVRRGPEEGAARRVVVGLTPRGSEAMTGWFAGSSETDARSSI
jgi:DNA-binding MarR family transcriptional regulator